LVLCQGNALPQFSDLRKDLLVLLFTQGIHDLIQDAFFTSGPQEFLLLRQVFFHQAQGRG